MFRLHLAGLLAAAVLNGTACGELTTTNEAMMVAPTARPTAMATPTVQALELAVVFTPDITTSANRYGDRALEIFAEAVTGWPAPGRGGLEVFLNLLSSTSYDASSTLFVGAVDGLPEAPTPRPPIERPRQPDLSACQDNAFARAKCEAGIVARYNAALGRAVEDEELAEREFRQATSAFQGLVVAREAEASALAEGLASLVLPVDDRGTDIDGALARAAEQLRSSIGGRKLLIVWSDLEPYGRQQPGVIDLTGIDVVVILDCHQGVDCPALRAAFSARVLALGATSIRWLEPSSAVFANLLAEAQ